MFDTDDDDFTLSPGSKLSSIFNATTISDESNASLKYKAPKQPKPLENNILKTTTSGSNTDSRTQPQSSVVLAKIVTLWKLDNSKNISMGKYMVAIIGSQAKNLFEVIIYQEKTKIIIRETLGKLFALYKYPNNFVALYDTQKQLWNLNFDSLNSKNEFLQNASKFGCVIVEQQNSNNKDEQDSSLDSSTVIQDNSLAGEPVKSEEVLPSAPSDLKQADEKPSDSKEKILSRIHKMGKPILPRTVNHSRSSELSDSETESSDPRPLKPITAPRKVKRNINNYEQALTHVVPDTNNTNNYTPHGNFMLPNNNQMLLNSHNMGLMYAQPMPDYGLSNLVIAQNAELKASLAEINMKLNNALNSSDSNGNSRVDECSVLRSKVKCQNLKIDNLTIDLEKSRNALDDLRKKYDMKCGEVSAEQGRREHLGSLEVEVSLLREKLQHLDLLQAEIEEQKTRQKTELTERDKLIEIQKLKLKDFEDYYKENVLIKEDLTKKNHDLTLKVEDLTLKVRKYDEELKEKENDLSLMQDNNIVGLDKNRVSKVVRESMNEVYRSIMDSFDENLAYGFRDIEEVLLENLKKTSYKLMNSLV